MTNNEIIAELDALRDTPLIHGHVAQRLKFIASRMRANLEAAPAAPVAQAAPARPVVTPVVAAAPAAKFFGGKK